jgi:colicin import membrane protein
MASRRRQRQYALALSVLVHGAIAVALIFSIPLAGRHRPAGVPNVIPIDTIMVDSEALDAEIARIDAEEQAAVRQQAEEEAARQEEIRRQQEELDRIQREREQEAVRLETEQKAAEEARVAREAEAVRLAAEQKAAEEERQARAAEEARIEAERQAAEQARLEAERKAAEEARLEAERKAAEEARLAAEREAAERRRREAVQAEIDRAIAAEQAARAARDSGLRDQWALAIGRKVELYWNRPPNVDPNLECVLVVTQLPDGSVTQVMVERCTTSDQNIIRSVENAVLNASPLPQRPNGVPFERQIRITFKPTE